MSRSGYDDDGYDDWALIRWRGAVKAAICGRRGQAFLHEMLAALDAMPNKRLIANEIIKDGEVCAIGTVAVARGLDVSDLDPKDREAVASRFGVAEALVAEIAYENDEWGHETPEQRHARMRAWVAAQLREDAK